MRLLLIVARLLLVVTRLLLVVARLLAVARVIHCEVFSRLENAKRPGVATSYVGLSGGAVAATKSWMAEACAGRLKAAMFERLSHNNSQAVKRVTSTKLLHFRVNFVVVK